MIHHIFFNNSSANLIVPKGELNHDDTSDATLHDVFLVVLLRAGVPL